jgi:hypothetical protein
VAVSVSEVKRPLRKRFRSETVTVQFESNKAKPRGLVPCFLNTPVRFYALRLPQESSLRKCIRAPLLGLCPKQSEHHKEKYRYFTIKYRYFAWVAGGDRYPERTTPNKNTGFGPKDAPHEPV